MTLVLAGRVNGLGVFDITHSASSFSLLMIVTQSTIKTVPVCYVSAVKFK